MSQPLTPFYVVPGYTFFYWGFTIAKRHYPEYIEYFRLDPDNLVVPITIKLGNRKLPAKLRMAQINNKELEAIRSKYRREISVDILGQKYTKH